jgi:exopolysaccharide biosynthesis polyprenyl glycosylphosphotransferase
MAILDLAAIGAVAQNRDGLGASGAARWQRKLIGVAVTVDLIAGVIGLTVSGLLVGNRLQPGTQWLVLAAAPAWLLTLALVRAYEPRFLGHGSEEFRRLLRATFAYAFTIAVVAFMCHMQMSRAFAAILVLTTGASVMTLRYASRRVLHAARSRGLCMQRVLAIGHAEAVEDLVLRLAIEPYHGMHIVGACLPEAVGTGQTCGGAPVYGNVEAVPEIVAALGVNLVAVMTGPGIDSSRLRRLAWELEDSGIELVVAPTLVEVAGPRIHVRPVCGLPLLHVEQPRFTGMSVAGKTLFDRAFALGALLILAPFLLMIGLLVRLTTPGPAIFTQRRVGRNGREFTLYKFRTMTVDAEDRLETLTEQNDRSEGLLFKMRADPRVTPIGRWLRRFSLDELPQLLNVFIGNMSLVGPRPALPREVARYGGEVRRRLLIKPGLTGMWQISGRSDLSWDESVAIDLRYVENWSFALDLLILWKTCGAVVRPSGAY